MMPAADYSALARRTGTDRVDECFGGSAFSHRSSPSVEFVPLDSSLSGVCSVLARTRSASARAIAPAMGRLLEPPMVASALRIRMSRGAAIPGAALHLIAIDDLGKVTDTGSRRPDEVSAQTQAEAVHHHLATGIKQADDDLAKRRAELEDNRRPNLRPSTRPPTSSSRTTTTDGSRNGQAQRWGTWLRSSNRPRDVPKPASGTSTVCIATRAAGSIESLGTGGEPVAAHDLPVSECQHQPKVDNNAHATRLASHLLALVHNHLVATRGNEFDHIEVARLEGSRVLDVEVPGGFGPMDRRVLRPLLGGCVSTSGS